MPGLMSRWIRSVAWAAASPSAICRPIRTTSRHVERAGPVEPLLERLAGDELHRQVRQRLLADLVDLHHVLVPHLGRRPGLAEEPLAGRRGGGHLRGQHLHRDDPVEHVVERPEDDPEPALAEHLEHLVMPDPAERVGPGGRREEPERHLVVVRLGRLERDRAGGRGVVLVTGRSSADRAGCPAGRGRGADASTRDRSSASPPQAPSR